MKTFWLGGFSNEQDLIENFSQSSQSSWNYEKREYDRWDEPDLDGVEILLAWYDGGGYDGEAYVLFRKCGTLYEVNGSHCSCYGLEGQWTPEETSVEALRHRLEKGELGRHYSWGEEKGASKFADELEQILAELEADKPWYEKETIA